MSDYIDDFLPKKDAFRVVKCHDHIELARCSDGISPEIPAVFTNFGVDQLLSGVNFLISLQ